jgi:hypothetical protein
MAGGEWMMRWGWTMWTERGEMDRCRGRGGAKGNGPCHAVKWRTSGRGEDSMEGDTTGRGAPHQYHTILDPPPPPLLKEEW